MEDILLSSIEPDPIHYEDIINYQEDMSKYNFGSLSVSIIDNRNDFFFTIYRESKDSWKSFIFPIEQKEITIINDLDINKQYTSAPDYILDQLEQKINSMWGDDIINRIESRYKEYDIYNKFNKVPNLILRKYVADNKEFKFRR